mmetsp:Transcript_2736/g.9249  ORF Transcript_2736/g.9249 Transcript_2736/m.9249 type:complete len:367 (-) Transcript_2736:58-1158(-)
MEPPEDKCTKLHPSIVSLSNGSSSAVPRNTDARIFDAPWWPRAFLSRKTSASSALAGRSRRREERMRAVPAPRLFEVRSMVRSLRFTWSMLATWLPPRSPRPQHARLRAVTLWLLATFSAMAAAPRTPRVFQAKLRSCSVMFSASVSPRALAPFSPHSHFSKCSTVRHRSRVSAADSATTPRSPSGLRQRRSTSSPLLPLPRRADESASTPAAPRRFPRRSRDVMLGARTREGMIADARTSSRQLSTSERKLRCELMGSATHRLMALMWCILSILWLRSSTRARLVPSSLRKKLTSSMAPSAPDLSAVATSTSALARSIRFCTFTSYISTLRRLILVRISRRSETCGGTLSRLNLSSSLPPSASCM